MAPGHGRRQYQNLYSIISREPEARRHSLGRPRLPEMDYAHAAHPPERGAKVTLAAIRSADRGSQPVRRRRDDEQERITGFLVKKRAEAAHFPFGQSELALASMGVYIFDTDVLVRALETDMMQPTKHDFGKDIIPALIHEVPVFAYRFYDETRRPRSTGATSAHSTPLRPNMDLATSTGFNLYDPEMALRTYQPQAPRRSSSLLKAVAAAARHLDSVISPGCIVSGSSIYGSVLCPNVRVHSFVTSNSPS